MPRSGPRAGLGHVGHHRPRAARRPHHRPRPEERPAPIRGEKIRGDCQPDPLTLTLPGGRTTYHWFGMGKVDTSGRPGLGHCTETVTRTMRGGGCGGFAPLGRHEAFSVGEPIGISTTPTVKPDRPRILLDSGYAQSRVTSVTAQPSDGTRVAGAIGRARGFPAKVWEIMLPVRHVTATLVFSDAAGRRVGFARLDLGKRYF